MPRTRAHLQLSTLTVVAAMLASTALLNSSVAGAASVGGLYEATVAGELSDQTRAVEEALRVVAIKLTGNRGAAGDPALASVYANATQYVQTLAPAGPGQVTVTFDAATLDAALVRAQQPLWGRERPATLVVMLAERPAPAQSLAVVPPDGETRRALEHAAQLRGLPLVFPQAGSPDVPVAADGSAPGQAAALVALARDYGADGVLAGRRTGTDFTWLTAGAAVGAPVSGRAADAIDALADQYARRYATPSTADVTTTTVIVSGIGDLKAYAATLAYLASLSDVRTVTVDEATANSVRYSVTFRGGSAALERALALGGQLVADPEAGGMALHFHRRP